MAEVVRLDSRDVDDVRKLWTQYVPSSRIEHIDPARFRFQWLSARTGGLSVIRYSLTATVSSAVRPQSQVLACRLSSPAGWVRGPRAALDPQLPWATDGAQVQAHWDGTAEVSALVFDHSQAEDLARRITDDDSLKVRLTELSARDEVAGQHWYTTVDYVLRSLVNSQSDELIEAALVRHALITTLSTFHTTFLDAAVREPRFAGESVVRRAIAYMDAHAHEPITVDDVATAAHISTRGLQYAFRRALGTTPTAYLRKVRLDGAHQQLQSAAADASVEQIARRWGFSNPSRFAIVYREVYGRGPRETLLGP